ncbi:polysaccharide lyase family 3 protein, partial [Piromyces sp. E2]
PFPEAQKHIIFNEPKVIKEGEVYDGLEVNGVWTSYGRGVTGQGDCKNVEGADEDAVFLLENGATLKNVILGADAIEHVHCIGDGCTVENVWWDDVCEDALSLVGSTNPNAMFKVIGGGARDGSDKIVQHNSAGTVHIKGFIVKNSGKLYRSCGNCDSSYQGQRNVIIEDVDATSVGVLAGINGNYGDSATFININAHGGKVCDVYNGNNTGKEPTKINSQCKNQSTCECKLQ